MPPSPSSPLKKAVFAGIIVSGIIFAAFFSFKLYENRDRIFGLSGFSADVKNGPADVFVDGEKVGTTPFESRKIKPGAHTIKIQKGDMSYETPITFTANSEAIVNRDLGVSRVFSSGQNFWLDSKDLSSKINVVSEPSSAVVYIDDVEVGKTPYSSSVLSDGEYDLKIEKESYEPQTARVSIKKGFKLNASVQLFLLPLSERPNLFAGSKMVFDLSSDNTDLTLDSPAWAKGVAYFTETRGVSTRFSYLVDYLGQIYDTSGSAITQTEKVQLKSGDTVAYLGRKSDGGMTEEAKKALGSFIGLDLSGKRVKVLTTPTGWLRVRSEPSLGGEEIARLNSGDEAFVLEEQTAWVKVQLKDGKEGWVSASYVEEIK